MSKFANNITLFFKGVGMGGADVVPGVSGGTIAFITGIYEELLNSIKEVDLKAARLLFSLNFKAFWLKINGAFLFPLFTGIIVSIVSLAKLIGYLLANHPISVWSFFFGLIVISSVVVLRNINKWNVVPIISLLIGIVLAYFVTESTPSETPESLWFVFLSGSIAICAMILPGISGSFIMLILGKYEFILETVNRLVDAVFKGKFDTFGQDLSIILVFITGCFMGLLSFARVVSWLLKKYYNITVGALAGFMLGSLNKVWPWKLPVKYRLNSHGEQEAYIWENVLPGEYLEKLSLDPQVFQAILFAALGIFIVVAIEKIAGSANQPS